MFFRKPRKPEEFERAAREVFPAIYSTALRLTRNRDNAEDLVQEALLRAFEAYERFDGKNFKAWVLKILTNLYINKYRAARRSPTVESLDEGAASEMIASGEAEPSEELLEGVMSEQVEEALAQLPEEYRTAVLLCDVEGMSYGDIAEALEVPIGTVRSRIARGRAMLRNLLLEYAKTQGYLKR